jgi:hypothetical protein
MDCGDLSPLWPVAYWGTGLSLRETEKAVTVTALQGDVRFYFCTEAFMRTQRITFSKPLPTKIFLAAFACELTLIVIYWFDVLTDGQFQLVHALFDLDSEGNIPAWFSSSQLFAVAITFFSCALRKGTDRRPSRVFFTVVGCASLYVSCDETAQIHERVTATMGARYIDWLPTFAAQNFFFVMLSIAVLVTVGQLLVDDLLKLWHLHRRVLLLAGLGLAIGLTGGMVIETLGYKLLQTGMILYRCEVTAEEFMEMFGASLILLSGLHLRRRLKAQTVVYARRRNVTDRSLRHYHAVS